MNPDDIYDDMIRQIMNMADERELIQYYCDDSMGEEETNQISEIYNRVWAEMDKLSRKKKQKAREQKQVQVCCINNKGCEEDFEIGVFYDMLEETRQHYIVETIDGKQKMMLKERFERA